MLKRLKTELFLMLLLCFGTGILDAATYLGLHGIFGANMTGNLILIGLGVSGSPDTGVWPPLLALVGFVVGAWASGWAGHHWKIVRPLDRVAGVMFLIAGLVLVLASALTPLLLEHLMYVEVSITVIGLAMGVQAVAARRIGVPDVTTVVVTSTLTVLFSEAGWRKGRAAWAVTFRRLSAVVSMLAGAVLGAALVQAQLIYGLIAAALLLLAVAIWIILATSRTASQADSKQSVVPVSPTT